MEAVDAYIPQPERPKDRPFLMPIEDVFSISGRGTVVTGRIERGIVKVGDEVEIVGLRPTTKTVVTGVEMFRKLLDSGEAGDNIGALLRGTKREEVERGQVLAKPGSITPHTKFKAEAYILTKEEGGRHTPFFTNYRPQFYFRTTDVTGQVMLPEGTEMVMPGDNVTMEVELIAPIAMDERPALRHPRGRPHRRRRRRRHPSSSSLGPWSGRRLRRAGFRRRRSRSVAQLARAPVSKTGGWGFESLHSCQPGGDGNATNERIMAGRYMAKTAPVEFLQQVRQEVEQGHLADAQGDDDHHRHGLCDGRAGVAVLPGGRSRILATGASTSLLGIGRSEHDGPSLVRRACLFGLRAQGRPVDPRAGRSRRAWPTSFAEVLVPTEEVVEVRRGAKVNAERKFFPGYVLVKMELTDETWHLVKNTPKVTGSSAARASPRRSPRPRRSASAARSRKASSGRSRRSFSRSASRCGSATAPSPPSTAWSRKWTRRRRRLKVAVSIFGRATPVELEYSQVEKV